MKRVLVTGASGFVGAHLCRHLSRSFKISALSFTTPINVTDVQNIWGDLCSKRTVRQLQQHGFDLVVHVAAKIRSKRYASETEKSSAEGARLENLKMMEGVLALQKPVVFLSSTAVHWQVEHPYVVGRREEEALLINSGLPFVVVRPCAPYGPPLLFHRPKHTESFASLVSFIRYAPILPMLEGGQAYRQPIHVEDLAALVKCCIDNSDLYGRTFDAAGAKAYQFSEIVSTLSKLLGKRTRIVSVPKSVIKMLGRAMPNFEEGLLAAMNQSEHFEVSELQSLIDLRTFEDGASDLLITR